MTEVEGDTPELAAQLSAALGPEYEVRRTLGAGGFAVVFLVRDLSLKRDLAVKVLSPDMITSKTVLDRFRREAETVAQLSHPNIVPLHFIGQQGDLLYLAMACVDGGSIADRLERETRLPVNDVVRIIAQVAAFHAFENHGVTGLQRQMQVRHQAGFAGDGTHQRRVRLDAVDGTDPQAGQVGDQAQDAHDEIAQARQARQVCAP